MPRSPSLYLLLISLILPAIFATVSLSAAYYYHEARQEIEKTIQRSSERSLTSLDNTISGLMESYAVNEYEKILANEISLHQHCAILVDDFNLGSILGRPYTTGYIRTSAGVVSEYNAEDPNQQRHLHDCMDSREVAVQSSSGERIGTIRLYTSDELLQAELQSTINRSLISTLFICVLMAMLLLILTRRFILAPLNRMMATIASTDRMGIPVNPISEQGPEELRTLARSMNSMITSIRLSQRDLQLQKDTVNHMAHHDALTGLANRILFNDRLESGIARAQRHGYKLALLVIDLDHFKNINDSLGHNTGDRVLTTITQRLGQLIRTDDTLARLGGDEFTIILEGLQDAQETEFVARKVLQAISQPVSIDEHQLYISSSIGISIYPDHGTSATELLMQADAAMNQAKNDGRNGYTLFNNSLTLRAQERLVLESRLREALRKDELVPFFQPQVNTRTGRVEGFEALARWISPDEGLISPARFIPLAESSGLIEMLDLQIMRRAMQHFVRWYQQGLNPGILSVNLNVRHFQSPSLKRTLDKLMAETGFQPHWLEVEVTETQLMTKPEDAIRVLTQLNQAGIRIALDDFGTGYSSLSYLKRLPITKLKIDQSFVRDLPRDAEDASIVRAVIALAESLGLEILAEGAETEAQVNFLAANRCDRVQGYFYARPMPAEDAQRYLTPDRIRAHS